MSGLAAILDENARLRSRLAEMDAAHAAALAERDAMAEALVRKIEHLADIEAAHAAALAERDAKLEVLRKEAERLAQALEMQRLKLAGPRSQRFISDAVTQALLPFGATFEPPPRAPVAEPQSDEEPTEAKPKRRTGKPGPKRRSKEDFEHLESVDVHCPASDEVCPQCQGQLKVIGQAESVRVDWEPGRFVRHLVRRDKCACPRCPDQGVLTVSGPYALDRSLAGNRLIARLLTDKFVDHIPAHRQAKRMAREGFDVGSHTLSSWICQAGGLLSRVADAVLAELLTKPVLQGDDTGMPVQDAGNGALRKGRFWAFTDQEQVYYAFTDTKAGVFPAKLLEGFAGEVLLVDGGSEFNEVVRARDLERAGCWSHLRSYFYDALHHHPAEAALALGTLGDLFVTERELWRQPAAAVLAGRRARSEPLVNGFFEWVKAASPVTRPDSPLGKALGYAIRQEDRLRVFLGRGDVPMHNNLSELMLRQPVVGRKNWLYARSEGGARAAAAIYTLVGSCMLQGIDPETYLYDLLCCLLDHPSRDIAALTPRNWRRARELHTA
jgi:transposase